MSRKAPWVQIPPSPRFEIKRVNEVRKAKIVFNGLDAGVLTEEEHGKSYVFEYLDAYVGPNIALTMPASQKRYGFDKFPPFFDGVLPEGPQLEALLRKAKLDRTDYFGQLVTVGADLVGAITVEELK